MSENRFTDMEQGLRQIAGMLILNGTLTECPGLVQGKMGIAVFFFHYAKYTGQDLFADYALDLLGEMQNQIHAGSRTDYEKGIAGIGVGIDYLIRNEFLDAEEDLFEDLDQRMVRAVMHDPWQDFSLYDGLTGYGRYWLSRLHRQSSSVQARECLRHIAGLMEENLPDIPAEEQADVYCFLHDWHEIAGSGHAFRLMERLRNEGLSPESYFPRLGDSAVGHAVRMYQRNRYFKDVSQDKIDMALNQIPGLDMEKPPTATGLLTGYAGEGLLRLAALGETDAWMPLL